MMYGEHDNPITVLSRLGQQLETALAPESVLPPLVETVTQTLKLPYVAIELAKKHHFETQPIISFGHKQSDVICYPLSIRRKRLGNCSWRHAHRARHSAPWTVTC